MNIIKFEKIYSLDRFRSLRLCLRQNLGRHNHQYAYGVTEENKIKGGRQTKTISEIVINES